MEPQQPPSEEELAAAQRDTQETWDAFIIVMGVSLGPLLFASIGFLLIHFQVIKVEEYNPTASTVKGLGRGLYTVTWFGIVGLILPSLYGAYVFWREVIRRKPESK